jgi:hypothetical protein
MENKQPATAEEKKKQETIKNLYAVVVKEVNSGRDNAAIAAKLAGMGMDAEEAPKFVEAAIKKLQEQAEKEKPGPGALVPAILGGLLAAVLCGTGWGLLAKMTDKEYGYGAIAVGLLCGGAVLLFTRGKKGLPLQIVAAACSLLGIFIGKYSLFFMLVKDDLAQQYGDKAPVLNPVSIKVFSVFMSYINKLVTGYDILWVVLAVFSAWGLLSPVLKRQTVK